MKTLLVVCIGNICRSPMAEGLLKQRLPHMIVSSAGIGALVGYPADPSSVSLMAGKGIDISRHRARQVNQLMCRSADLILVMDGSQRTHIEKSYPFVRGKVFKLADQQKEDIPDPYRMGLEIFEQVLSTVEQGVESWATRINQIIKLERQPI